MEEYVLTSFLFEDIYCIWRKQYALFYMEVIETTDHLFLHCFVVQKPYVKPIFDMVELTMVHVDELLFKWYFLEK